MVGLGRFQRILLYAVASAALFLSALGHPALWEPDEGRYAEVAREMVVRADYITPRNNWVRYFEKPPLVYWATAAALKLFGRNEFAVRLEAALFSVGQVVITAILAEAMFGITIGLLAALVLALSPLFFNFARFATPDPALAFFVTAALGSFYAASCTPDFGRDSGRHWMILAASMTALGTLAKGPVALLLAGGSGLTWLIIERRVRDARRIRWLECAAVYLLIAMPWFVMVARRNPGFLEFFLLHEHLRRYLESTEHGWGPWFFVPVTIAGMWPWLYFAPLAIRKPLMREGGLESPRERTALLFLLTWFGVVFVFFSLPRSKLGQYILPGIPPLAIIAGYAIVRAADLAPEAKRRVFGGLVVINAVIAGGVEFAAIALPWEDLGATLLSDAIAASTAVLVGSALTYLLVRRNRALAKAIAPLALGVIAALVVAIKAREDAASMFSYRSLARTVTNYLADGCHLASYHHYVQGLPFYTGQRELLVGYRGELAPFGDSGDAARSFIATDDRLRQLWASRSCMVLITNRNDLPKLEHLLVPRPAIIGCEGKKFALYNQSVAWLSGAPAGCRDAVERPRR